MDLEKKKKHHKMCSAAPAVSPSVTRCRRVPPRAQLHPSAHRAGCGTPSRATSTPLSPRELRRTPPQRFLGFGRNPGWGQHRSSPRLPQGLAPEVAPRCPAPPHKARLGGSGQPRRRLPPRPIPPRPVLTSGRPGLAWHGPARPGAAGLGSAGLGSARLGGQRAGRGAK